MSKEVKVREVLNGMLEMCDGAQMVDGVGFNKFDARFAREMASKNNWTYKQEKAVYDMLEKYEKQIMNHFGIKYKEIKIVNKEEKKKAKNRRVDYDEEKDVIYIKFKYNSDLVNAVKKISGRRWNNGRKRWEIGKLNKNNINQLRGFVKEYNFEVTDKAVEKIEESKDKNDRQIKIKDDMIVIKFDYNPELVSKVKSNLSDRSWNNNKKRWESSINSKNIKEVLEFGKENDFDISDKIIDRKKKLEENVEKSKSLGGNIDIDIEGLGNEDLELKPFQKAGVEYGVEKKKVMIADEMGLGKTVESLAIVQQLKAYPLLVVCPATLKLNWKREIKKWLNGNVDINIIEGQSNDKIGDGDVQIINYDILHHNKELLKDINFESVIFDESHKVKNHKAKRTKAAKDIVKDLDVPVRIALTGTPIKNRPKELISQLDILDRLNDLGGFWSFAKRYCNAHKGRYGWDLDGASNLEELNRMLREVGYIRREKEEVLEELPNKVRTNVPVEIDNRDEYNKAKMDIIRWINEKESVEKAMKAKKAEILVRLNTLKRLVSEGKKRDVIKWVRDFLESGEKLILFAHHVDLVKSLKEEFNALAIYGETSLEEKQNAVDKFQNDEDEKLIVISLQAGSEGITLTEASNVAFAELGWTPAEHNQAEDRCHRIGQEDSVNAWYLIAEDTIDEDIKELIEKKREIFESTVNGDKEKDMDIVEELVSIIKEDEE